MPTFSDWLDRVLSNGESVQAVPPRFAATDRPAVLPVLAEAFRMHALDVGGPALAFDPDAALSAAVVLANGCWRVATGSIGTEAAPADRLGSPRSPDAHLSADVCLRFLPAVYRRAKPRGDDRLTAWAAGVMCRWPLSGVLAELPGEPAEPPTFAGHPGLQLLYAERLAAHPSAGWVPPPGPGREQAERVFRRLGKPLPVPAPAPEPTP